MPGDAHNIDELIPAVRVIIHEGIRLGKSPVRRGFLRDRQVSVDSIDRTLAHAAIAQMGSLGVPTNDREREIAAQVQELRLLRADLAVTRLERVLNV